MGLWVKRYCPACHVVLENWGHSRVWIGVPFVECTGCRRIVLRTLVQEWDQKSDLKKTAYVAIQLYTAALYGGIFPFVYIAGAALLRDDVNNSAALVLWLLGGVGFAAVGLSQLFKDIEESRQRLLDPNYRTALFKLRLARPIDG